MWTGGVGMGAWGHEHGAWGWERRDRTVKQFFWLSFFKKKLSIDLSSHQCQQLPCPLPLTIPLPSPIAVASRCCPSLLPVTASANFLHVRMEACGQKHWKESVGW